MSDLLEVVEDGIGWLTLNRPDRLNALSPVMVSSLGEVIERLGADRSVGAIIVTGAGRAFCAGGDVKTMASRASQGFEERVEGLRQMHRLPMLLRTIPKIVIAMVNGPAVGTGLGLAMACDLRIAGRSARFGSGFAGVGYSGDFGGSWSLTRLVGTAKARELYFLGDIIDAIEAASVGLVNRIVEDEGLRQETLALARRIADGPLIAYRYNRAEFAMTKYMLVSFKTCPWVQRSAIGTGTFLCGEIARNQSGRLSGSIWRSSNSTFFSRSTKTAVRFSMVPSTRWSMPPTRRFCSAMYFSIASRGSGTSKNSRGSKRGAQHFSIVTRPIHSRPTSSRRCIGQT
jgi:2-(1,2-epoxy-1,2-dihydrophenyl)acetyl-CoA isomerase